MIAYAGAQCLSSDFTGALETCLHAVELAVRIGRPDLAAEAAMVPEPTFDERIDRVIRALCERALAVLDGAPASVRARLLAQYAWVCDLLSDLDAALPAARGGARSGRGQRRRDRARGGTHRAPHGPFRP